jgi:hypothetical protein
MARHVRINLHLPETAAQTVRRLCEERKVSRATLIRQALGVLQVVHDATREGYYVGTTLDREQLATVIIPSL